MKNKALNTTLKLITGAAMLTVAYAAGAGIIPLRMEFPVLNDAHAAAEKMETPKVEANLIETHTVEYVEEKVVETEYVDVVREVQKDLRNFYSLEELKQWLANENRMTIIRFNGKDTILDCDDYASEMQREGLEAGYIVSFEIIGIDEYNALFTSSLPESRSLHAINLVIIGNDVYYIEPQTCEVVQAAYLD